jgi:hypothetical protein
MTREFLPWSRSNASSGIGRIFADRTPASRRGREVEIEQRVRAAGSSFFLAMRPPLMT